MRNDEIINCSIEHRSYVTWEHGFSGHPTELIIKQYEKWAEVCLKGGGFSGEWERIIHSCPVEVLRNIVAIHDALPKFPEKVLKK